VICFADNVDRAKLDPEYLDHLKPWAESLAALRLPNSTSTTAST
jgi:hypothetical protein